MALGIVGLGSSESRGRAAAGEGIGAKGEQRQPTCRGEMQPRARKGLSLVELSTPTACILQATCIRTGGARLWPLQHALQQLTSSRSDGASSKHQQPLTAFP